MKNLIEFHLFIFLFLISTFVYSQDEQIQCRIIDKETNEAIPYATIYKLRDGKGTISSAEGYFNLINCFPNDSIRISFIGYETIFILASDLQQRKVIYLTVKAEVLGQVNIYGENTYLFDIIARSKKTQSSKMIEAKTYFSLETYIDTSQVEWLEGYYNGEYRGYELEGLNLKNTRVSLSSKGTKYFVSLSSSKAQYTHRIYEYGENFPESPFELSKKKLKKKYRLKLARSYKNEDGHTILLIDFTPKKDKNNSFKGRVWIDSLEASIQKVTLQCIDATDHPFFPIWKTDSLLQMDLNWSKTYKKVDGRMYVDAIDFHYRMLYKDRDDSSYVINTHNMIYAYDYNKTFLLPFFDFGVNEENDYRKVNATPYNAFFWENMDEFTGYNRKEKNEEFLSNAALNSETIFLSNTVFNKGFFEQSYVFWSKKRIAFDYTKMKTTNDDTRSIMASDNYNLSVKIYLDINLINDSLQVLSSTILDPFESYYYFPRTTKSTAFLNMYFDIVEIQRRELLVELGKIAESPEDAKSIYDAKMLDLSSLGTVFFKNVERGYNKEGMLRWNDYIVKKLNIDNWEIFGLDYEFQDQ